MHKIQKFIGHSSRVSESENKALAALSAEHCVSASKMVSEHCSLWGQGQFSNRFSFVC